MVYPTWVANRKATGNCCPEAKPKEYKTESFAFFFSFLKSNSLVFSFRASGVLFPTSVCLHAIGAPSQVCWVLGVNPDRSASRAEQPVPPLSALKTRLEPLERKLASVAVESQWGGTYSTTSHLVWDSDLLENAFLSSTWSVLGHFLLVHSMAAEDSWPSSSL